MYRLFYKLATPLSLSKLLKPSLRPTLTTLSSTKKRPQHLSLKTSIDRHYFLSIYTFLMPRTHRNRKVYSKRLTYSTCFKNIPSLSGYIPYSYFTTQTGKKSYTGKDSLFSPSVATNKHLDSLIRSCPSIQTTHNAT